MRPGPSDPRIVARWALGLFLVAAGTGHFLAPEAFLAQTPTWLPARRAIVLVSGVVEVVLGVALLLVRAYRRTLGLLVAAFFVAILPGNVHQAVAGTDAFGLETPRARLLRLAFQPLLVLWALWSTGVIGGRAEVARGSGPAEGPEPAEGREPAVGPDPTTGRPPAGASDPDLRP
jgi:uncharacterized membrane protein